MMPPDHPIRIDFTPEVMAMVEMFYWLAVATLALEVGKWLTSLGRGKQ